MKRSIKLILGGAVFCLPMLFTSCGNVDNPLEELVASVAPTPEPESPVKLTSITLNKATTTILIGKTETLTVEAVTPDDATDKTVTWSSDKTAVATVDDNGLVTAVAVGTAIITATANDGSGVEGKCTVKVLAPALLTGKFTINNSGKQVQFSRGNLQYTKSTDTWSLMDYQWDTVETASQNVGDNYADQDVVSLFGWGTSGYNHRTNCYQPYSTSSSNADYYAYNDISKNLYEGTGKADWGYNKISNGGNTENDWRTLTKDEWTWLIGVSGFSYPFTPNPGTNCRTSSTINGTPNARCAKAYLDTNSDGNGDIHGLILFPDDYTHPTGVAYPTGINDYGSTSWSVNKYNAADWAKMEAAGAVFLPAAGVRNGATVDQYGTMGRYWSSSYYTGYNSNAQFLCFYDEAIAPYDNSVRYFGCSVRLVKNVTP